MGNILSAENISKSYTGRMLFDKASFFLHEGEKVGIIGINGTGKSTLLKILAGLEEADEGNVVRAGNVMVGYLPQNPVFEDQDTVLGSVLKAAVTGHEAIRLGNETAEDGRQDLESRAKSLLTRLGITDFLQKTGELSGGQKKRLALVSVLLEPCEILILDEPTNHLDAQMSDWLEEYLRNWRGALIMVTHDRYFLDSVAGRIAEVDRGKIYSYETNYSGFLELKAERMDMAQAAERKRQSVLRKEIEWMRRGARARSTKQKAHIQRYEELRDRKAPEQEKTVEMSSISSRMGKTTVELNEISKAYGENVLLRDFSYIFLKNDRVGFVGSNGCGKTTLMKIIEGREKPDSGSVVIGQTIKIGYYSQEIETAESAGIAYMDPQKRVIDYLKDTAEYVRTEDGLVSASAMLERFLFPPEEQYSLIGKLSGGEKRRLNLLRVLMEAPNVLILDEPTNDLDTVTLTILEDYLDTFAGIVITVSHDRYFLDRVVNRIFAFEGNGKIVQYEGGYTDYAAKKKEMQNGNALTDNGAKNAGAGQKVSEKGMTAGETDSSSTWKHEKKLKFSYKEQREYETIEDDIAGLEARMEEIDTEMEKCASDFVRLNELTKEKIETENQLEEKLERWEYLEELAAKIRARESAGK